MSTIPENLRYTREHEWAEKDKAGHFVVGITDFAQSQLGDVVHVEFPAVGRKVKAGETLGVIESVKTVSDLFSPLAGEIVEVNKSLENEPQKLNENPYKEGWIVKIKTADDKEFAAMLSPADYKKLIQE